MSTEQEKRFFWQQFLAIANRMTDLYQDSAIRKNKHYIHINTGMAGLCYSTTCKRDESWVEVCIQRKHDSEELYDDIKRHQHAIERKFGEPLRWINAKEKQRCKIMTRPVARGRVDSDIHGLSKILVERTVHFHNAIQPFLPVQGQAVAGTNKQAAANKTTIKRKKNKTEPVKTEQIQLDRRTSEKDLATVESLFKKSMSCRTCFEKGIAIQANIDIAQPRLIGKNYFSTTPRIMVIALNPGAGNSAEKRKANRSFSQWLYDYREGRRSVEELFSFQAEYMKQWGTPPGKYLRFYCDGIGLSLENIAMANIAWCADAHNKYPSTMLNDCFRRHTDPLIRLLDPSIVILSGGPAHRFAEKIKQILPGGLVIQTLHYAHREGRAVEERQLQAVQEQIAQFPR